MTAEDIVGALPSAPTNSPFFSSRSNVLRWNACLDALRREFAERAAYRLGALRFSGFNVLTFVKKFVLGETPQLVIFSTVSPYSHGRTSLKFKVQ